MVRPNWRQMILQVTYLTALSVVSQYIADHCKTCNTYGLERTASCNTAKRTEHIVPGIIFEGSAQGVVGDRTE